ncbi:class I adenylate-forming enzyme family protein [Parvibaculum sp.]|uniref:class I adenylate-forming enzyme family protein n=1 Tax=Parvibaculum sp. TaxID=2024848 RepID=UPI00320EA782
MITNRIYELAHKQPDKVALVYNGLSINYADFARTIEATRRFLAQQELPAGRNAVVLASGLADAWVNVLALRALGLTTISVHSIAQLNDLHFKDVACIVTVQVEEAAHNFNRNAPSGAKMIVVPSSIYAGMHDADLPRPLPLASPYGGHVIYTSGTTGTYKKVLWDGANEDSRIERLNRFRKNDADTVHHSLWFPLWTAIGLDRSICVWHAGGTAIIAQQVDALRASFKQRISKISLTPGILKQLIADDMLPKRPQKDCELICSGGFLSFAMAQKLARESYPRISIHYGSTECQSIAQSHFKSSDDLLWLTVAKDRTVEIVDDDGHQCEPGAEGELRVKVLESDMKSYLDDEDATSRFFRGGYFYPGDIAIRREDGRIRILGRIADVLNIQGFKVASAPLEEKVQKLLDVDAVCLFSGLSASGKDELFVAIEADRMPPQAKLDTVVQHFPQFEGVRFEVLSKFPRTIAGTQKIKRTELRKLLAENAITTG